MLAGGDPENHGVSGNRNDTLWCITVLFLVHLSNTNLIIFSWKTELFMLTCVCETQKCLDTPLSTENMCSFHRPGRVVTHYEAPSCILYFQTINFT